MSGPLRLWHQSMTELETLPSYRQALQRQADDLLGDRVRVEVHGLVPGSYAGHAPSEVLGHPYAYHLVLGQVVDAARAAEREGCDGFVIGSFSEPFLRQARSAVDIPVASMAEATLVVAASLGARVAMVANTPAVAGLVDDAVHAHRLGARVSSVTRLGPTWTEDALEAATPVDVGAAFTAVAEQAVGEGADVVVPAEGVLAAVVRGLALTEVDGAPVLDTLAATWLHAELLARLFAAGARTSRRSRYSRAPDEMVDDLRSAARDRMVCDLVPGGRAASGEERA